MKYSIVIPAYCAENTIENTVESIRLSGLPDFEILIIDDGSTDGTPAICDGLAEKYEEVRCVHKPNGGVSSARNRGIDEAQGEYIWFFDADDYVDEGALVRSDEIIRECSPDMLIFGLSFDFFRDGKMYNRWELVHDTEALYSAETIKPVFEKLYYCNALSSMCNKMIKRSLVIENGLRFDENLLIMEDLLFSVNALKHCSTVYVLPQAVYRYVHQYVKNDSDDPSAKRLARIPALSVYLKPFEKALEEQPRVLSALFFLLLGQKLRTQKPKEIAITAEDFISGPYAEEPLFSLCPPQFIKNAELLKRKKCVRIYLVQQKNRIRSIIVRFVKRTAIYKKLKGKKL